MYTRDNCTRSRKQVYKLGSMHGSYGISSTGQRNSMSILTQRQFRVGKNCHKWLGGILAQVLFVNFSGPNSPTHSVCASPMHNGRKTHLLVVLVSLVVDDVEELELVDTSGGGDDTEPVTELLLLEELLGAVNSHVSFSDRLLRWCNWRGGMKRTGT